MAQCIITRKSARGLKTLIWNNLNTNLDFDNKTFTVPNNGYNYIEIEWIASKTTSPDTALKQSIYISLPEDNHDIADVAPCLAARFLDNSGYMARAIRPVAVSFPNEEITVSIEPAFVQGYTGRIENSKVIPYKVYGVKMI